MKILSLEIIWFKVKNHGKLRFPPPNFVLKGFYILRINTDQDIYGLGEISSYVGNFNQIQNIFTNIFSPIIVNKKISIIDFTKNIDLKKIYKKNISKQILHSAVSAIIQALLDIKGKINNKPVFELLNSKKKLNLKAYASGGLIYDDEKYDKLLDEVLECKHKGFFGWKLRPSIPRNFISHQKRVKHPPKINFTKLKKFCVEIRKKVGPDFKLMIDLGCRLDETILSKKILDFFYELDFYFIEEPFKRNIKTYKKLLKYSKFNIAAGENTSSCSELNELLSCKKINFFQPDSNLNPIPEIIKFSKKSGVKIILHNWTKSISMYSNFHLGLALDNCKLVEYSVLKFPEEFNFLKKNYLIKKDRIILKRKNGLGIELNHEILDRHTLYKKIIN